MSHMAVLEVLLAGRDLSADDAESLMQAMFDEDVPASVKGAALALLRHKGATGTELASFARVLRRDAVSVDVAVDNLVDTCGTGGGTPSFNMSTGAALIACGAGAFVAKHGNRAVTSTCGSADVLEQLGVLILGDPAKLKEILLSVGIAFLFAPGHHPTMKKVGPVRQELGFKTVFNQLGPLANPFHAKRQLVGVYDPALILPMAEALADLGAESALVVHGRDGLDEISPCTVTECAWLQAGQVRRVELSPADFGQASVPGEAIRGGADRAASAAILQEALTDSSSPRAMACLPNAAAALVIAGVAATWAEGAELARRSIDSGAALAKLEALVAASRQ